MVKLGKSQFKKPKLLWNFRFFGFSRGGTQATHKLPARKMQDLKLAFSEYYLSLVLLQNYQNLNYTGN